MEYIIIIFIILIVLVNIFNKKSLSIIKQNEIQDYLKEYYQKYEDNQFVELNSKLDDTRSSSPVNILSHLVSKGTTIQKIMLKNNIIELYDKSNDKFKTYLLDQVDIKYDILIRGGRMDTRFINIYFNDDNYTSIANNNYDIEAYIESYIAFVIFINLLKTNELEKLNNLNNDELKKIISNFTYSEESIGLKIK